MLAARVIRIPILPFRMVNAHLVVGATGCVLVDAGLPGSSAKVESALSKLGLSWTDIKVIVVTHAHVDHAGGAAEIRARSGAAIVAHDAELHHLSGEVPMTFCPTGWFGDLFAAAPLIHERYTRVEPDIVLSGDETLDLARFGVPGVVRPTPGHTAGSLSVLLDTHEALVGDLLASGILLGGMVRNGHAIRPPFEEDPSSVSAELARFVDAGVRTFHVGHGGPIDANEVRRHAGVLAHLRPGRPQLQRFAARALNIGE